MQSSGGDVDPGFGEQRGELGAGVALEQCEGRANRPAECPVSSIPVLKAAA
jgi:hypothetical protein